MNNVGPLTRSLGQWVNGLENSKGEKEENGDAHNVAITPKAQQWKCLNVMVFLYFWMLKYCKDSELMTITCIHLMLMLSTLCNTWEKTHFLVQFTNPIHTHNIVYLPMTLFCMRSYADTRVCFGTKEWAWAGIMGWNKAQ